MAASYASCKEHRLGLLLLGSASRGTFVFLERTGEGSHPGAQPKGGAAGAEYARIASWLLV